MKVLIVPDSYKGSLTAKQVCSAISEGLKTCNENIEILSIPLSDGGEGFTDCLKDICNGEILYTKSHNIYGSEIDAHIISLGDKAVIDCATSSGLLKRKQVMQASSYGTGELIKFAVSKGFSDIILGLGGTGCCDGGMGALAALGAKFYDENQNIIERPKAIDMNGIFGVSLREIVKPIHFTFACDVDNTYYGTNGAAYVFAPQKGARKTDVAELDEGLRRLNAFYPRDISKTKGAGAAGGICGGLYAVYSGNITSGFDIIANLSKLEDEIINCDMVITGEGKTDEQTLMGKLPYRVSLLAKKHNKECVVISGCVENVSIGDRMISLVDGDTDIDTAISQAYEILKQKAKTILK